MSVANGCSDPPATNQQAHRRCSMASRILSLFSLSLLSLFLGCGGNLNPAVVHAATPAPPTVTPQALTCGPVEGGENCHWVSVITDTNGNQFGYCQGDVYMWPHSISFSLEIGLTALINDPTLSGCNVFVPRPATILNLRGNLALKSWNGNNTSIATWLYVLNAGQKNILHNSKMQTQTFQSVAVPFEGSAGQPLVFANGGYAFDSFLFWFNNDLVGSTPATISVAGSGDII